MDTLVDHIALTEGAIHVWQIFVSTLAINEEMMTAVLDEKELRRADQHRFAIDRLRFVTGRAVLRLALQNYGMGAAKEIRFSYSDQGKPLLVPEINPMRVQFNVSHSSDLVALGFAVNHCVGIDVEHHRAVPEILDIAERFFSVRERAELLSMPESERQLAFFKGWTRKEAVLKAIGRGLDDSMEGFSVALNPNVARQEVCVGGSESRENRVNVVDLELGPSYSGAVAFLGDAQLAIRRFVLQGNLESWAFQELG